MVKRDSYHDIAANEESGIDMKYENSGVSADMNSCADIMRDADAVNSISKCGENSISNAADE